ncbi:MAG TPA: YceI family protein [Polyangiaceae bacterium]|nr:YceI family protein [Polyangiaceae bacterium]
MRLELRPESIVRVDLRSTGLLQSIAHNPTLTAHPEPFVVELGATDPIDVATDVRFPAAGVEPPGDMSAADRERMRDNVLGRDVLDAARFPAVELHGRYVGNIDGGTLSGDLRVRGAPRPISMAVRVERAGDRLVARGTWEGRLTDLGIKPFRALLGAIRLEDWVRLRLEAVFSTTSGSPR